MDLIGQLSSQFGIDASQAEGLAGGLLGAVKDQVADKVGESEAAELAGHIPEMGDWQEKAASLAGGGEEGGGGLMGMASGALGALGGGGAGGFAALLPMLTSLKLDSSSLSSLLPIGLEFLKSRLPEGLMSKVAGAVPGLSGGDEGGGGGLAGLVGGMLS